MAVVALVIVGACGGGDGAPEAADFVLQLEDFDENDGWIRADEPPEDEATAALNEAEDECRSDHLDQTVDEGESPTFSSGAFVTAASATAVTEGADDAEEFVAEYEDLVRCYEGLLLPTLEREAAGAGSEIETIPFYEVDFPPVGERRDAWTMQWGTQADSLFVDLIVVQRDRGVLEVVVLNDGSLSVEDEAAFISSAVERMPGG